MGDCVDAGLLLLRVPNIKRCNCESAGAYCIKCSLVSGFVIWIFYNIPDKLR